MITKPVADCYVYRCRSFSTVAFIAVCVRTGSIRPSENVYKVQFVSARRLVCIERRPLEVFRNLDRPHFQERNVLNSSLERVAFIVGSCLSFQRTGNFKPRSRLPAYFGCRSRMNLPFIWQRRAKRSGEPGEWQGAGMRTSRSLVSAQVGDRASPLPGGGGFHGGGWHGRGWYGG